MRGDPSSFEIAQINVGRVIEPVSSPRMAAFVAALEPINALADASPGFVWRLQDEGGNATSFRGFDDDRILLNMSVWRSLPALRSFVYRSAHVEVMRRRQEWFEQFGRPFVTLWWVPAGHRPSVTEARERLEKLERLGPTPAAFTFRDAFEAPPAAASPRSEAARRRPSARGPEAALRASE